LVYTYELYTQVYEKINDPVNALKYSKLYNDLSLQQAEINSQDKIKALEFEQKISENERLLKDYENERKTYIIIIGFILLIVFLGSILFYSVLQNKKRKIANIEKDKIITEIDLKNKQLQEELLKEKVKFNQKHLISFANQVNKIDAFLDELKKQIKSLPLNQTRKEEINNLKLMFNEITGDQNQLKQISSLNSEINQDFFLMIRKQFTNLTKSEEQLLAFLIREMSSKEIAGILNITTESVNKKRYRLRKKLNMDNEQTFKDLYEEMTAEDI